VLLVGKAEKIGGRDVAGWMLSKSTGVKKRRGSKGGEREAYLYRLSWTIPFTWVVYVWDTLKLLWRKHKQCLK
jgi:hypothetical protein